MIFVLIAIFLIIFFSTSILEKRLKKIEEQNAQLIALLKEIRDKN